MKTKSILMLGFLASFCALALIDGESTSAHAENVKTTSIQVHYHRNDKDYANWDLWMWSKTPSGNGAAYLFTSTDDYGGVTDTIQLSSLTTNQQMPTEVGVIYRTKGSWDKQSSDIVLTIPETSKDGIFHAYLLDGSNSYYTSMPEESIISADFTSSRVISVQMFVLGSNLTKDSIQVLADGNVIESTATYDAKNCNFKITLKEDATLDKNYQVRVTLKNEVVSKEVGVGGLYDTPSFVEKYYYDGDDLGATISEDKSKTTFKLWAPVSSQVTLKLYQTGTPASLGGDDTPIKEVQMEQKEKGVWVYEENQNLHNTYYTYDVTNNGVTNKNIVDPYAKGCGVNGLRGLVVDFSKVNPDGFTYGKRANSIQKRSDATIYELHVRDYTKSDTWGGSKEKQGKYLGLVEEGTYYQKDGKKYATGLDHLKEMGVSHIQIMPIYDQATVDESVAEPSYNWGYDPLNYNCLEGSYASDAKDGLVRIREFKEMMMALTEAGIRVNMDVVYNHTAKSADSNFDLIVPGYYHRMTSSGAFSNGSGCGNEMASERAMVRKFILDSTRFLYTEYNFSGYRFDLMGLIDKTTMEMVYEQLYEIDPLTLVYGEPWTGGTSTLKDGEGANKETVKYLTKVDEDGNILGGVGKFNDDTRDSIVGRVPSETTPGWVQADKSTFTNATYYLGVQHGITGGTSKDLTSYVKDATQTINYVSCHDNNTLWDKIQNTMYGVSSWKNEKDFMVQMNKQADTIVFFSEGIPFIQEGQEFLRSKPKEAGYGEGNLFDHNSYRSPDSVNMVRWNLKAENASVVDYYKDLIQFRKDHEAFKMSSATEIEEKLTFLSDENTKNKTAFIYRIQNENDMYQDMIIIHNTAEHKKTDKFKLPEGKWKVAFSKDGISDDKTIYQGEIYVDFNESVVLYNTQKVKKNPSKGCGKSATNILLGVVFVALLGGVILKKKETL